MTSDEIISSYGLRVICEPMPEEIERAISEARRLRAEAFRDLARAAATWLAGVLGGREAQPADTDGAAKPAPTA